MSYVETQRIQINVYTVTQTRSYGSDEISDEQWDNYQENYARILNEAEFYYHGEYNPGTDCAIDIWSDCEDFTEMVSVISGVVTAFEPKEPEVEITELEGFSVIDCAVDMFQPLTEEQVRLLAERLQDLMA